MKSKQFSMVTVVFDYQTGKHALQESLSIGTFTEQQTSQSSSSLSATDEEIANKNAQSQYSGREA
jgi:hypothetical protein